MPLLVAQRCAARMGGRWGALSEREGRGRAAPTSSSMATSVADHADRTWKGLSSGSRIVTCSKGCHVKISTPSCVLHAAIARESESERREAGTNL